MWAGVIVMRLRKLFATVVLAIAVPLMGPAAAGAVETFGIQQLTVNLAYDYFPCVSANRVAWCDLDSDGGIFTWTPSGGVVRLAARSAGPPQVSGDRVAWLSHGGSDGGADREVFTWTPTEGVTQITRDSIEEDNVYVSGNRLSWEAKTGGGEDDTDICTWMASSGIRQLTTNATGAMLGGVSGHRVVWIESGGSDGGTDREVFTWTPSGGVVQVTRNDGDDYVPRVSTGRISWLLHSTQSNDWVDAESVFTWTPLGGVQQLTDRVPYGQDPDVSGDRVVWAARSDIDTGTDWEIFSWTPNTGVDQLTSNNAGDWNPRVSGDRVVWSAYSDRDGGLDIEIFTWTPWGGPMQVTANQARDAEAVVAGDRIAWVSDIGIDGGADCEVFTAVPSQPHAEVSPASLSFGEVAPGGSVSATVTLLNAGESALAVKSVGLDHADCFSVAGVPSVPALIARGNALEVRVVFAPTTAGETTDTLVFTTDDPMHMRISVPLSGTGIPAPASAEEQIADLLAFYHQSLKDGTLRGVGSGASSRNRARVFERRLWVVSRQIHSGRINGPLRMIQSIGALCDGKNQPPDFVAGEARAELHDRLQRLSDELDRSRGVRSRN